MAIANSDGSIILSTKVVFDGMDKVIKNLKNKFSSLKEGKMAVENITEALRLQKSVIQDLEMQYAKLVSSGQVNSDRAKELREEIKSEKQAMEELKYAASTLGAKTKKSFAEMSQGAQQFGKRIAGIMKSAIIFSVLYKVMQSFVKLFQKILVSDEEFHQDWEELKAAFYAAAYPIINLIVPAIKYIVHQVKDWAVSIGKVAAALQGISYSELIDQAKSSKEAAENYADMEKSSKKTADNVKKQLASFDDIQILSSGNDEEQGAGLAGFEGLKEYDTSGEKSMLSNLMTAIGGALAALGIILLFKGQIGWGIGFIVAGATFWGVGEIWGDDYDPNSVSDVLSNVMQTISVSLSAVGIILLTNGQLLWGIGFIIAGASAWAISEIATKEFSENPVIDTLAKITESIGVSLAAVGLMLIIKGIWTWGIAFVVAGVAVWGITEFAVGEFSEDPIVNALVKIMGIAGTALLAIGIILCVFGVITPVSIGMIVAGAGMLVSAVALNSEAIVEAIRGPIGIIMAIVSGALLVLGIILVCTGVGIPLGIGLILAGATGLATVVAVNWDSIVGAVQNAWNAIKEWVTTYGMLVIGILLCLTGVGIPFGIGIIADWAKSGAAKGVPLANSIVEKTKEIFNSVKEWIVNYGMLVLGIFLCLTGVGIPFGIGIILQWAKDGAEKGIPLSAAILGKIQEVWGSVKDFWNRNISPIFTTSYWLNLSRKAGNGLIQGFEKAINGIIGMFEKMINWVVDGLNRLSFDVPEWVPGIGSKTFGFNIPNVSFGRVSIPRLAQGAVIPPNREFLAVLGDQKRGTNIEAPLQTIVEAFNIALGQNGGRSGNTEVVLEIDGRELGRAVVEQGNRENRRIGTRLVIA
ncbi:MAG: hypothetical protein U0M02_06970 [Acutalibacteraceae bacterium]|nr:hypothetical protein [Acutalibacteraceae bacterium]